LEADLEADLDTKHSSSRSDCNSDSNSSSVNSSDSHDKRNIAILSLNVCGLTSKLKIPEFNTLIAKYDIVCISESKLDDIDDVKIDNYTVFTKNRKKFKHRSGGVAILVKSTLTDNVKIIENDCESLLLLALDKCLLGYSSVVGCVYIPPEGSDYEDKNVFDKLNQELASLVDHDVHVCLLGDFNARTSNLPEFTEFDEFVMDDEVKTQDEEDMQIVNKMGLNQCRKSRDLKVNNYGYKLLNLCKEQGLYMLNGRVGNDINGEFTCKNKSVVDYGIASPVIMDSCTEFEVMEFLELYSDVHCPIHTVLKGDIQNKKKKTALVDSDTYVTIPRWAEDKKVSFVQNLSLERINVINEDIVQLANNVNNVKQMDIDNLYSEVCNIIQDSGFASETLVTKKQWKENMYKRSKPKQKWFSKDCEIKRREFFRAKNVDKMVKSENTRVSRIKASRAYKKELNKCHSEHKKQFVKKLRGLKSSNPKEYWNLLKGGEDSSKTMSQISTDIFYNHFKMLNTAEEVPENINVNLASLTVTENDVLNCKFTNEEVLKCLKKLKNNKACGNDLVKNEFIKASSDVLLTTITMLFNLVLDSGKIPDAWTEGVIVPIFKKGDTTSPDNYRGITLLSCVSKLFTSVINERLSQYLEDSGLLGEEQAGFRHGYSTIDHTFTLKCIIDLYLKRRKRLYCAFVDYRKAFDTVNRIALWQKLASCMINGKVLNVIFNMYDKAKSCVRNGSDISNYFPCQVGVRQGENLSPLLFAIYLNDLSALLAEKTKGLQYMSDEIRDVLSDDDIEVYLKMYVLLYADDTILLAESATDLQVMLDTMEEYCNTWELDINISKTKIVIFSRGKVRNIPVFLYKEEPIDVVDSYNYLGIIFNYNGRPQKAVKRLYDQASKAMFGLLRKARKLSLPIDVQIDLFDKLIAPIMLYGSESWGTQCLDIVNKLQVRFYKLVLGVRVSTPSVMVLGELGKLPLEFNVKLRMLMYWFKIVTSKKGEKFSHTMYHFHMKLDERNTPESDWVTEVRKLFNELGLTDIYLNQKNLNLSKDSFKLLVEQRLKDSYIQKWYTSVENDASCVTYRLFKTEFKTEEYLSNCNFSVAKQLVKFRVLNHNLPVEKLKYSGIERQNRRCNLCPANELGDEFHYLFTCSFFKEERNLYVKKYYYKHPNVLKFKDLLCTVNARQTANIVKFIKIVNSVLK
jgi:hypothetical protein